MRIQKLGLILWPLMLTIELLRIHLHSRCSNSCNMCLTTIAAAAAIPRPWSGPRKSANHQHRTVEQLR